MNNFFKKISAFALVSFLVFSCSQKKENIPENLEKEIIVTGKQASKELTQTLKTHLIQALQENELIDAFEFCAVQAIPLTEEVNERLPENVSVKRISFRFRNPANAPDDFDRQALEFFRQAKADSGKLPPFFVQKIGEKKYRYYQPLQIGKPCLKCHGARESIDPDVLASLQENYPDDRALGYKEGDFRGAVRVEIVIEEN